jgi:hypothetical protein
MNLKELLKIESKKEIYSFRFYYDNSLLWPYIRTNFYSHFLYENYQNLNNNFNYSKKNYIKNLLKLNPYKIKDKDIFIFGTSADNTFKKEGKFFNRVHDYFNFVYPDNTAILESSYNREFKLPRYFNHVYSNDIIKIKTTLASKLKKINENDYIMAKEFIKYIKKEISNDLDDYFYDDLYNTIINIASKIEYNFKFYEKFFIKTKPKIIFLNCGYYGGENYILRIARSLNIKTAEFQHGLISNNHIAYNYDDYLLNFEEYKYYIPEYYLSYGEYWNEQINIPGNVFTIGNPHFYEQIKKYKNIPSKKDTILIPSQGTITKEMVEIAIFLATEYKNYDIIFKLHPGELNSLNLIKPLEKYSNIFIKKDGDIFDYIAKSEVIVACYSTTIFEAIGMGKKVYILDNNYSRDNIPDKMGVWFRNCEELRNKINENEDYSQKNNDINYFFNNNWEKNYKYFIEEEVGIKLND